MVIVQHHQVLPPHGEQAKKDKKNKTKQNTGNVAQSGICWLFPKNPCGFPGVVEDFLLQKNKPAVAQPYVLMSLKGMSWLYLIYHRWQRWYRPAESFNSNTNMSMSRKMPGEHCQLKLSSTKEFKTCQEILNLSNTLL